MGLDAECVFPVNALLNLVFPALIVLAVCFGRAAVAMTADPALACDAAAQRAARASDVPLDLLRAITRVETGRGAPAAPWPWTVNSGGKGLWFANLQEAVAFAETEIAAGRISFDIGCFQMNLRWHGNRFTSLEDMFDPERNASEAAGFLSALHAETGSWTQAAAAYHSRDAEKGTDYVRKVAATLKSPQDPAPAFLPGPLAPMVRPNLYPLLTRGSGAANGSLVPVLAARNRLIGGE
ncbi:MAG: transglycosylase SLT domain-containing protein [Paracoccaceae bacterium]